MQKAIEAIKKILTEIAQPAVVDGIEYQLVFDDERHHYQINAVGWTGKQRIHGILVQIDIKDDTLHDRRASVNAFAPVLFAHLEPWLNGMSLEPFKQHLHRIDHGGYVA
jgi:hypothetical protein